MHKHFSRVMVLTIVGGALLGLTPVTDASEGENQSPDTYILGPIKDKRPVSVAECKAVNGLLEIIKKPTEYSQEPYVCIFKPSDKKNKPITLLHVYKPGVLRVFYKPNVFDDIATLYLNAQGEGCLAINEGWDCNMDQLPNTFTAKVSKAAIAQALTQAAARHPEQKN